MLKQYETNRLILRVLEPGHASLVLDFYKRNFNDFNLYEPLFESAKTLQYHRSALDYEYHQFSKNQFLRLHFFEKANPMIVIGTVSYRSITHSFYESCLIGYKIDKNYRRLGYAKEALQRANRIVFDELNLHRIEANVLPDNTASMRLLESLNFQREGLLRDKIKLNGRWEDHYLYALLKEDAY